MHPTTRTHWVDPAPFRAHLRYLIEVSGLPWQAVVLCAGLSRDLGAHLLFGRDGRAIRRLHPGCAADLLAVQPHDLARLAAVRVPAASTTRRVNELLHGGDSVDDIAAWARVPAATIVALAHDELDICSALTAVLVRARPAPRTSAASAAA